MATIRFKALEKALSRKPLHVNPPADKTSDYYSSNVFDIPKMKKYLSKEAYEHVMDAIEKGNRIERGKRHCPCLA